MVYKTSAKIGMIPINFKTEYWGCFIPAIIMSVGCFLINLTLIICGVIHAFSASVAVGVLSLFGLFGLTQVIELVDWFSTKEIWQEIAKLIG